MAAPTPGPNGPFPPPDAPGPEATARPRTGPLPWFTRGGWYVVVVVLSLGMLSFVPFVHAATRTRKPLMWVWVALYTTAVVTMFLLTDTVDVGGIAIALMIIASIHAIVLRPQVWPALRAQAPTVGHAGAGTSADPAVAAVLAATDPQMARELGIGRPDLPRAYDDGGLVDLNSAPPQVIAQTCGIEPAVAMQIVEARAAAVTFTTVDDVFSFTEIPYVLWDRIRDRAMVIAG